MITGYGWQGLRQHLYTLGKLTVSQSTVSQNETESKSGVEVAASALLIVPQNL